MPEKAWKRAERAVARQLGGERTPLSGKNSRHTSADGIHIEEYLEHKRRKQDPVHEHLTNLTQKARRRDRWPLISYDLQGEQPARWIALWLDRYLTLKTEGHEDAPYPFEQVTPSAPWLIHHEVGRRLPHGTLVLDTAHAARAEHRPPLVVITKHRSPKRVALVPTEVPR